MHRQSPTLKYLLNTSKIDRLLGLVIVGALVINVVVLPAFLLSIIFNPWAPPVLAAVPPAETVGPATEHFVQQLKNSRFAPLLVGEITRRPFTVSGRIITLKKDNIQVFEYPDQASALKDASRLRQKYAASGRSVEWKKKMHLYVADTLVIFYMGNQNAIIKVLDQKTSLAKTPTVQSLSALSGTGN